MPTGVAMATSLDRGAGTAKTRADVHDVARAIISEFAWPRHNPRGAPGVSTSKLHRLLYLSQGWHLALTDSPLFTDDLVAWPSGPHCPAYHSARTSDFLVVDHPRGELDWLTEPNRVVIKAVVNQYGALSGIQLSEMDFVRSRPYLLALERGKVGQSAVIAHEDLRSRFKELLTVT